MREMDTTMPGSDEPADRARGLMAGIAAGNLLGIVQEGWSGDGIAARFPDGVRDIAATPGRPDDDDVAQAIVIAEAAERGPLDVRDLGPRLWAWAELNGAGMGGLTGDVLTRYGGARPQRRARNLARGRRVDGTAPDVRRPAGVPITEASRAAWDGGRAGNGAAMRCAPLAIRWLDDPRALVRNSVLSAAPTHWDWRCGWSCVLVNLAAAAALRGERITADELLATGMDGVRAALPELQSCGYQDRIPRSVKAAVRKAWQVDIDDLAALDIDGPSSGYTLLALQVGLIAWRCAWTFEDGLRRVVEAGGDTDTNGAVAGALLGARFGLEGIPRHWRDRVAEIRADRTPMEQYADRLLAARDAQRAARRPVTEESAVASEGTRTSDKPRTRPRSVPDDVDDGDGMRRDDYLSDANVSAFVAWLRPLVSGERPFPHEYRMLLLARDWRCGSLWEAYENYWWHGDFETNRCRLDRLSAELRDANERRDKDRFVAAVREVLDWGGVAASGKTLDDCPNPLQVFRRAARRLDPCQADTSQLDGIPMNSGWTKVYALMLDGFPMYDGRVGAALGYLVRQYCEEQGIQEVPALLRFRWQAGKAGNHNHDPSKGSLQFPRLSYAQPSGPRAWAEVNLWAAWILGAVQSEGEFGRLPADRRLRALEAALFMIGYELPTEVDSRGRVAGVASVPGAGRAPLSRRRSRRR